MWNIAKFSQNSVRSFAVLLVVVMAAGMSLAAPSPQAIEGPVGPVLGLKTAGVVPVETVSFTDIDAALAEDMQRQDAGLPPRFALPEKVSLTPDNSGSWTRVDKNHDLWRVFIDAPGAVSLNLGFTQYELPKGARLSMYPADYRGLDDERGVRVFDRADNRADGSLWTPMVLSDQMIVELLLPNDAGENYRLEIGAINKGYRAFTAEQAEKQGTCNIDVVCPEGDDWWNEINSVGVYTVNGTWYCTGAMINNTAEDQTPYFLTADHCGVSTANDQGVVIYWNFQSVNCGDLSGGSLTDFTSGTTFQVDNAASDVTLLRIDSSPDPSFGVSFSGWDRRDQATTSAVAIHHPNTDEKAISFENDPTSITTYLQNSIPGDGTHIRITDWDLGTTEPGSSGSPLYSPEHRIIGQLHGGYAACGNNSSDWYGRLAVSWPFLSTYLDPIGSGAMTLDTYAPGAVGLRVTPSGVASVQGDPGGPFTPGSFTYTVENIGGSAVDFTASTATSWLTVVGGSGTLAGYASTTVEVQVNAGANSLAVGTYAGLVDFVNLTDGVGDTSRAFDLTVGVPTLQISEPLDADPGWTMNGLWAYGQPTGGGGDHGNVDPTSGFTGANVLGYNLTGDYENNLTQQHLVSAAFDCSAMMDVTVKFQRYLNVEQPAYDHAYFSVSNDGVNFTQIWTNGAVVEDNAWSQVEYDISAIADGQPTVYLRWTMGTTDGSWQYSGWNIDDIEFWGLSTYVAGVGDTPLMKARVGNYPNPFNPTTRIDVSLQNSGAVRLDVYDVQGRLVRSLYDGHLEAGLQSFVWDGNDDRGSRVGSGVYFGRLSTSDTTAQTKMVLLK